MFVNKKSLQKRKLLNIYASGEAFSLEGIERNRFPYQNVREM